MNPGAQLVTWHFATRSLRAAVAIGDFPVVLIYRRVEDRARLVQHLQQQGQRSCRKARSQFFLARMVLGAKALGPSVLGFLVWKLERERLGWFHVVEPTLRILGAAEIRGCRSGNPVNTSRRPNEIAWVERRDPGDEVEGHGGS